MRNFNISFFLSLILFPLLLGNCQDEDFTTDSSYKLTLSVDTLSFDTIFSESLTATKRIMVYNNNNKSIRIDKIYHESSVKCFQINVNGKSGSTFNGIELSAKDSMYIFVQARAEKSGKEAPFYVLDSLVFLYNGNRQDVKLTAYGQDAYRLKGFTIEKDTLWTGAKPFLIFDTLTVAEGATLTLQPGTKLYFHNNAHLQIKGRIIVNGDFVKAPVLFRGDRLDYIYDNILYDKIVGQWDGISITKESTGNIFNGCIIRSCNTALRIDSAEIDPANRRATLSNSWIHNTKGVALKATNANIYAYNTIISNALNANLLLQGGEYLFNHCSIIGYPRNSRFNSSVVLSNYELHTAEEALIPLQKADFNNCIIMGTYKEEIKLSGDKEKGPFLYSFRNCLLKSADLENENASSDTLQEGDDQHPFVDNQWNGNPGFVLVDWDNYEFDFRLDSTSAAIGKADKSLYKQFPECRTDIYGEDRASRDSSDIGASLWIKEVAATDEKK